MKTNFDLAIETIQEKIRMKSYILKHSEISDRRQIDRLVEQGIIKKISRGYYLLTNPLEDTDINDVILNTYYEKTIQFILDDKHAMLSEIESYLYQIGQYEKRRKVSGYFLDDDNRVDLDLGPLSIILSKRVSLFFEPKEIMVCGARLKTMNVIDILFRIMDSRTAISNHNEFISYVFDTIHFLDIEKIKFDVARNASDITFIKKSKEAVLFFANSKIGSFIEDVFQDMKYVKGDKKTTTNVKVFEGNEFHSEKKQFSSILIPQETISQTVLHRYLNIFDSVFEILPEFENLYEKKFDYETLISFAKENKRGDVYHSTTIEGYKISEEDVSVFLGLSSEKSDFSNDQVESYLAVKGYSVAFDFVINNPTDNLDAEYLKTIFQMLWSEAFKRNGLSAFDQRRFRTAQKQMRGSVGYSMPAPNIIYDLVDIFCLNVNSIENRLLRAIVGHFLFAPIQAFEDGNGRVSRFIMNSILTKSGYKWKTITQHDYRLVYLSQWGETGDYEKDRLKIQDTFRKFVRFIMKINA